MYILDANVFITLGFYYQKRFPTLWSKLNTLADGDRIISVKEVLRELDKQCSSEEIQAWITDHRKIFVAPTEEEMLLVSEILKKKQYQGFVRRKSILNGLAVADPFIVAAAIHKKACVVTQESNDKNNAARIPNACKDYGVKCINLEGLLEEQGIEL